MFSQSIIYLDLLIGFVLTLALAPSFINFLYKHGIQRQAEKHRPIYRYLQIEKTGVPSMGGMLIIISLVVLTPILIGLQPEVLVILLTMILYGVLGGVDDIKKIVVVVNKYWGLRRRHIFLLQMSIALVISYLLSSWLGIAQVTIPVINLTLNLGWLFIPYATLLIVATSNAFNITDGIDGLSAGLLIISLCALMILSGGYFNSTHAFMAIWIGSLLVYLYFNITPARFMMGDVGAQPFGAMLAVIALINDQSVLLLVIGGMFFIEAGSSAIQMLSRKYRNGKKVLIIAPLHYHFQVKRWSEGKICMRFWLFGIIMAIIGLAIASL